MGGGEGEDDQDYTIFSLLVLLRGGGESGVGACGLLGILGRGSVQREKPAGLLVILVWGWTFLGTFLVAFL